MQLKILRYLNKEQNYLSYSSFYYLKICSKLIKKVQISFMKTPSMLQCIMLHLAALGLMLILSVIRRKGFLKKEVEELRNYLYQNRLYSC